jgi:hypothetical protein
MKLCPRPGAPGICVDHELLAQEHLGVGIGLDCELLSQVLMGSSSTIRSSPRCSWGLCQPAASSLSELLLRPRCFLRSSSHSIPGASPLSQQLSGKHLVMIYIPAHPDIRQAISQRHLTIRGSSRTMAQAMFDLN